MAYSRNYQRSQYQTRTRRDTSGVEQAGFTCRHCNLYVPCDPALAGVQNRNHCPYCLHSRHVDRSTPGDRASDCGSTMAPVGIFARPNGEQVLVHCCLGCRITRANRVAADDNFDLVMALPEAVQSRL